MNKVILMGRLTRDPEIREGQTPVAKYTLAVDNWMKDKDADFISCVAFGKNADFANNYLKKGVKIVVSGRIQTGKYQNKEGRTIYTTDVVIESQEFAESRKAAEETRPEDFVPDELPDDLPWK